MSAQRRPRRVLLKVSGNALSGTGSAPFDAQAIDYLASELAQARQVGCELAVVVGGGNVIRGVAFCAEGLGRIRADCAGMLATVVNALVLRTRLEAMDVPVTHYAAFSIPRMAEAFEPQQCVADLESGRLVLLAGGTGCPLFTTDTAAALRAAELRTKAILKATKVDGIYDKDPVQFKDARLFKNLTYIEVLSRRLKVMDSTAISLAMDNNLPIIVFNLFEPGNIKKVVTGQDVGTLVTGGE